jgi:hypothetical protein
VRAGCQRGAREGGGASTDAFFFSDDCSDRHLLPGAMPDLSWLGFKSGKVAPIHPPDREPAPSQTDDLRPIDPTIKRWIAGDYPKPTGGGRRLAAKKKPAAPKKKAAAKRR